MTAGVAQKGKTMILKLGDGATAEAFTTIGGMRTTSIVINNTSVDITDKDSNSWQTLLADAGGRSIQISASGIYKDNNSERLFRDAAMTAGIDNYQVMFEDGSYFQGGFQIESLTYDGENNGTRMYSATLKSSGTITFTGATAV